MDKKAYYLKNETDGEFYPYTHIETIVNDNGEVVDIATKEDVDNISTSIESINNSETGILKLAKTYTDEKVADLAVKSTVVNTTITSDLWTGEEVPYTATVAVEGVTADIKVDVTYNAETITEEQYNALSNARIINGTRSDGVIIFTAYGSVPTVDIPLIVTIGGE